MELIAAPLALVNEKQVIAEVQEKGGKNHNETLRFALLDKRVRLVAHCLETGSQSLLQGGTYRLTVACEGVGAQGYC